jgi:hypothetical protein
MSERTSVEVERDAAVRFLAAAQDELYKRQERIYILESKIERLRGALEKHHWPDLVPGDGPCERCGLSADEWYG